MVKLQGLGYGFCMLEQYFNFIHACGIVWEIWMLICQVVQVDFGVSLSFKVAGLKSIRIPLGGIRILGGNIRINLQAFGYQFRQKTRRVSECVLRHPDTHFQHPDTMLRNPDTMLRHLDTYCEIMKIKKYKIQNKY